MLRKQTSKQRNDKREKAKQRRREESFRLRDTAENPVTTMPAMSLICLHDLGVGIPYETVLASVTGELSAEMEARARKLRQDIVAAAADGHEKCDGLLGKGSIESLSFDDVVCNSKHIIETLEMFVVTLCDDGYLGWRADRGRVAEAGWFQDRQKRQGGETALYVEQNGEHRGNSHGSFL